MSTETVPTTAKKKVKVRRPKQFPGDHADGKTFGDVVTDIYANHSPWGETIFKVVQKRKCYWNEQFAKSFRFRDLWDVIRGAHWAHVWIKKRQRNQRWKEFVARFL